MMSFLSPLRNVAKLSRSPSCRLCTSANFLQKSNTDSDFKFKAVTNSGRINKKGFSIHCPFCDLIFPNPSLLNLHLGRRHSQPISDKLRETPVETYTAIFGNNYKSLNDQEMRYDNGLVVTLYGDNKGCWYSFAEGVGGGPLKAIRHVHGFDFKQTLEAAAEMTQLSAEELKKLSSEVPDAEGKEDKDEKRVVERAKNIKTCHNMWEVSVDVKDTLAEHYLLFHRGIPLETIRRLALRFLPDDAEFLDHCRGPRTSLRAVLIRVENPAGELTGVQRIFLDENGRKANFVLHSKKSFGMIKGSMGVIQRGVKGGVAVIVEGAETGASIASVLGPEVTVLASLSVSLLKEATESVLVYQPKEVILAVDNDVNAMAQQQAMKAYERLKFVLKKKGIGFRLAVPRLTKEGEGGDEDDEECQHNIDFNDVLMQLGEKELLKQLGYS